mmetsp:Transcript_14099/g.35638  ORF Transcript_14099/g.35638 Transcript_14099/m.35638 type:complete len:283 (+) Transcript_14099:657-1505(+)
MNSTFFLNLGVEPSIHYVLGGLLGLFRLHRPSRPVRELENLVDDFESSRDLRDEHQQVHNVETNVPVPRLFVPLLHGRHERRGHRPQTRNDCTSIEVRTREQLTGPHECVDSTFDREHHACTEQKRTNSVVPILELAAHKLLTRCGKLIHLTSNGRRFGGQSRYRIPLDWCWQLRPQFLDFVPDSAHPTPLPSQPPCPHGGSQQEEHHCRVNESERAAFEDTQLAVLGHRSRRPFQIDKSHPQKHLGVKGEGGQGISPRGNFLLFGLAINTSGVVDWQRCWC